MTGTPALLRVRRTSEMQRYLGHTAGHWQIRELPLSVIRNGRGWRLASSPPPDAPPSLFDEVVQWMRDSGLRHAAFTTRRDALAGLQTALHASPPPWPAERDRT